MCAWVGEATSWLRLLCNKSNSSSTSFKRLHCLISQHSRFFFATSTFCIIEKLYSNSFKTPLLSLGSKVCLCILIYRACSHLGLLSSQRPIKKLLKWFGRRRGCDTFGCYQWQIRSGSFSAVQATHVDAVCQKSERESVALPCSPIFAHAHERWPLNQDSELKWSVLRELNTFDRLTFSGFDAAATGKRMTPKCPKERNTNMVQRVFGLDGVWMFCFDHWDSKIIIKK